MYKVNIVAIGEHKEKFFHDGENEFVKRLNKFCKIEIRALKESSFLEGDAKKESEAKLLEKYFVKDAVLLSIEGIQVTSNDIANLIKERETIGGEITFFIGGSNGVTKEFEGKFINKISLGKITLPHSLCRVVLVEQIYRAFTILNNMPYHK